MADRYNFDDLPKDRRNELKQIGKGAEIVESYLSGLTGAELAAWGDRIGDPMRTLLEMRSIAIRTRMALEDGDK